MRRIGLLVFGYLLVTYGAHAQSVPSGISQGVTWTPSQWQAAFGNKVDVNNGSLTGPIITNGTINLTGNAVTSCSDQGENGTTTANTAAVCAHVNINSVQAAASNETAITGWVDTSINGGSAVGGFFGANSLSGGAEAWGINPLVNIFPGSVGGGIANELDLNNWACDPGNVENPRPTCHIGSVGTLYQGASPYPSQSAIDVSGVSIANAQWHEGFLAVGAHVVDFATIYQNDGATYGYRDVGAHGGDTIFLGGSATNPAIAVSTSSPGAIDLRGSSNTQFGIAMPSSGPSDIYWPAGGTLNSDGSGGVKVGGTSGNLTAATSRTIPTTTSTLPSCTAAIEGTRAFVTDASSATPGTTDAGAGSYHKPVFCEGSSGGTYNWVVE